MTAIDELNAFLGKSPSCIEPWEVHQYLDAIKAENGKLRELARQMHTCLTRPKAYTGKSQPYLIATECPYFTQGACDYNSCGFERRMRELGVETDG